jgi:hypothetical protein
MRNRPSRLAGQSEGKVLGDERNKDDHSSTACVPLANSYEIGGVAGSLNVTAVLLSL